MVPHPAQAASDASAGELDEPIRLAPHDPEWGARFERERILLAEAIGEWAGGGIHHVGSTAIPGVDAEPVIDILVGARDRIGLRACLDPLTRLGYRAHTPPDGEAHFFRKPDLGRPAYELVLLPIEVARYSEMLAFRDLLRADRRVAIGYAGMKRDLVGRNAADRRGYSLAKAELIRTVLAGT